MAFRHGDARHGDVRQCTSADDESPVAVETGAHHQQCRDGILYVVARRLAEQLATALGQTVTVENKSAPVAASPIRNEQESDSRCGNAPRMWK